MPGGDKVLHVMRSEEGIKPFTESGRQRRRIPQGYDQGKYLAPLLLGRPLSRLSVITAGHAPLGIGAVVAMEKNGRWEQCSGKLCVNKGILYGMSAAYRGDLRSPRNKWEVRVSKRRDRSLS